MTSKTVTTLSPVGRIVQGHPLDAQTKDADGNPLVYKSGPNAGQPRVDYFFSLAVSKQNPDLARFVQAIKEKGAADFPGGEHNAPTFSWKMIDGDGVDNKGKPFSAREGFAGHVVFRFSGGYAPEVYTKGGGTQITAKDGIKCGDFVRVQCSFRGNGSTQRPGVYLNHNMVEVWGYGDEIRHRPDAATVFGGQDAGKAWTPDGMSDAPTVGTAPATAPATPVPTPAPAQPAPAPTPAPAHDFVQNAAGAPPPPSAPTPPPAKAEPILEPTAKCNGASLDAFRAQGWSDDQLVEHGYAEWTDIPF